MPKKKNVSRGKNKKYEVIFIEHPLASYKLSLLLDEGFSTSKYHGLAKEIGMFLCFYMTRDISLSDTKKPAVVSMLRSGLILAEGFREINPSVRIGHIGIFKNANSGIAEVYLASLPDLRNREVMILDMNISTGSSAIEAISLIKEHQKTCGESRPISFGCVTAKTEGIRKVQDTYPDVSIFLLTKDVDEKHGQFGYFSNKIYGLD